MPTASKIIPALINRHFNLDGTTRRLVSGLVCWAVLTGMPGAVRAAGARRGPAADDRRPLLDVARFYGFPNITITENSFECRSAYSSLRFAANSRRMIFNNTLIYLNAPAGGPRDRWRIESVDADTVLDPLLRSRRVLAGKPVRVVVLDPGHGGVDSGAVGSRNVQEKRVVLDIARRVRAKLSDDPFVVHLTRDGDYALALQDRVQRANALRADVFVSIHVNAAYNNSVTGVETFVLPAAGYPPTAQNEVRGAAGTALPGNRFDAANTLLGYLLHRELLAAAQSNDRGLKRARFVVLKDIQCPAVLLECGFVSNPREEALMLQAQHRDRLAEAIAKGIRAFANRNQH